MPWPPLSSRPPKPPLPSPTRSVNTFGMLQEQLNEMAMLAVNTFGTLQWDAPLVHPFNCYLDPLNPNPNHDDPASKPGQPQAQAQPPAPAVACARPRRGTQGHEPRPRPRRQEGCGS